MTVILEFTNGNRGFERLSQFLLFMLPKRTLASEIDDFRPIVLSNAIYLIVARTLANRLRDRCSNTSNAGSFHR